MYTFTPAPEGLTAEQAEAFEAIRDAATNLHRYLTATKRDIDRALAAFAANRLVAGIGYGAGPIGHQAPFDIAIASERLAGALAAGRRARLSEDAFALAYTIA